jgi:hypothetical protein
MLVQQPTLKIKIKTIFLPNKYWKKKKESGNYNLKIKEAQTCRLSEDDDAREDIKVLIKTGIISLRVLGVLATIVFHTCKAA